MKLTVMEIRWQILGSTPTDRGDIAPPRELAKADFSLKLI